MRFEVVDDIVDGNDGVYGEAVFLGDFFHSAHFGLTSFHAVYHDDNAGNLCVFEGLHGSKAFADCGACGDNVLNDDDLFAVLRNETDENAAFAVVLCFLAVEEEGNVDVVLRKRCCCGYGNRNTLVSGAVKNGVFVSADLVEVVIIVSLFSISL